MHLPAHLLNRFHQGTLQLAVSGLLVFFLVVQTLASFGLINRGRWPFMTYGMYGFPRYKNEPVLVFRLIEVRLNGDRVPIEPADLSEDFWQFHNGPITAAEDGDLPALRSFINPILVHAGIRLKAIQLVRSPYLLQKNGVEKEPDELVTTFRWASAQ